MNMITNRTAADVERWKFLRDKGWANMSTSERQEWLGEISPTPAASRGMYTHNDLNRVETAVKTVVELLQNSGVDVPYMTIKTNWTYKDRLMDSDIERYFSNISIIRGVFDITLPNAPKISDKFDFNMANNIEKILVAVEEMATKMLSSRYYSSEIFSGEV